MDDKQFDQFLKVIAGQAEQKNGKMDAWRVLTPILLCFATIANGWVAISVVQAKTEAVSFKKEFSEFKDQMSNRMASIEGFLKGRDSQNRGGMI